MGRHAPAALRFRHVREMTGLVTVLAVVVVIACAIGMFGGHFTTSASVDLITPRAGLVMNPDAEVEMRGVRVGKVAAIESLPDGVAKLRLAIDPSQLPLIPSNVAVDITSSTVFGAKSVRLIPPDSPSSTSLAPGTVLHGGQVTVEVNTVFERLTGLLDSVEPEKLNDTLSALSQALNGRGRTLGTLINDFDTFLAAQDPTLDTLRTNLATLPAVAGAYADAAPDLVHIAENSTTISRTVLDTRKDLDGFLLSAVGLADAGNDVLSTNRDGLTATVRLLLPTTSLINEYLDQFSCTLQGLVPFTEGPPLPEPGIIVETGFTLGAERYRYPGDLPEVAAGTGVTCAQIGMPRLKPGEVADYVVLDTGANPYEYGNPGIRINSDGLKQMLFGPIDGPPRNSAQVGMPG